MTESKQKVTLLGKELDVAEVPIKTAQEYFNEYELEDGTHMRVKGVTSRILRVENQYLPDGNPIYLTTMNPVVVVVSSPLSQKGK